MGRLKVLQNPLPCDFRGVIGSVCQYRQHALKPFLFLLSLLAPGKDRVLQNISGKILQLLGILLLYLLCLENIYGKSHAYSNLIVMTCIFPMADA